MSNLSSRITNLSQAKRILLEQILKEKQKTKPSSLPPIYSVARSENLPASFSQTRLWFLDQLEPNNTAYNLVSAYKLNGKLDVEALRASINEIVKRHESLRTCFAFIEETPVQIIKPSLTIDLPLITLESLPRDENQTFKQINDLINTPLDLSCLPLCRAMLIKLEEEKHILVVVMHHIISDGWSMGVFHKELTILYESFLNKKPYLLSELPIQYADYAVWQKQWLQDQIISSQIDYWKEKLTGIPALLALPTDKPRPAIQRYHGAELYSVLPQELAQKITELSHKENATLFMIMLAVFKVLLYRYSNQEDIVVGTPIAGRNHTQLESLIGFFGQVS